MEFAVGQIGLQRINRAALLLGLLLSDLIDGKDHSTSEAKSASRERSPRRRVMCALCSHALNRSTA